MDAVHTDATFYGSLVPVGHLDFYPGNVGRYGLAQPQFDLVADLMASSHSEAMDLYAISFNTRYVLSKLLSCFLTGFLNL